MNEFKYVHPTLGEGLEDLSGLIWFPSSEKQYSHKEALDLAEKLNLRLPTKEEIQIAIDNKFNLGEKKFLVVISSSL